MLNWNEMKTFSVQVMPRARRAMLGAVMGVGLSFGAISTAFAAVELRTEVRKVEMVMNESGEVERRLLDAAQVVPGDELYYMVHFENTGAEAVDPGSTVITNPLPEETQYVPGSAIGSGTEVSFSVDGESFAAAQSLRVAVDGRERTATAAEYKAIRWVFEPQLQPGEKSYVAFRVRLK